MMRIGVPREIKDHEYRVALTPSGARELVRDGNQVFVERSAGVGSSFGDDDYVAAGAQMVEEATEAWTRSDLIIKVKEPIEREFQYLRADLTLFTYLHLAAARPLTEALLAGGTTAIAYETVQTPDRRLPLLAPMSEVAGRMAPQVAAHLLEREQGGRGMLMGGVAGVDRARVVVLGGGIAGLQAARIACGLDADVTILDSNIDRLRTIDDLFGGRLHTLFSTSGAIDQLVPQADVIIGSVLIPGARAPKLVTAQHVAAMKPGAVLVDIAVDQGGCFETSRVTTHSDPTYVVDGIVHYCVGNMPGAVPFTSTSALTNLTLPYVRKLAAGVARSLDDDPVLALGLNTRDGHLTNAAVAEAHDLPFR